MPVKYLFRCIAESFVYILLVYTGSFKYFFSEQLSTQVSEREVKMKVLMDYFRKIEVKFYLDDNGRKEIRKIETKLFGARIVPFIARIIQIFSLQLDGHEDFYGNYITTYKEPFGDTIHFSTDAELQKALADLLRQNRKRGSGDAPLFKVDIKRRRRSSNRDGTSKNINNKTDAKDSKDTPVLKVYVTNENNSEETTKNNNYNANKTGCGLLQPY
ncbi:uncharacterized protein [Macrobrachium rosenbergii]|uniref:uncharacterized protein isoform X1 n=1 Tax=Macrobrachium rosenbergii TaxID=79674 RepID=UPI0034D660DA